MNKNVAIIGASDNPERYAYKAFKLLTAHGYNTIPINPKLDSIENVKCLKSISDFKGEIDTITIYVKPAISSALANELIDVKPRRIIMNPGTENDELIELCEKNGIKVVLACTLVLLSTGQF